MTDLHVVCYENHSTLSECSLTILPLLMGVMDKSCCTCRIQTRLLQPCTARHHWRADRKQGHSRFRQLLSSARRAETSGRITVQPWLTFNCLKVKMVPGYESEKGNCRMWPLRWNSSLKLHFPIILLRQKKSKWQKKANITLCCFKIELILDAYLPDCSFNSRCTLQPHPRVLVSSSAVQPEESEKFSLNRWTSSLVRTLTAKTSKTTQTRKYVHLESDVAFVCPLCAGTPRGRQAFNLTGESAGERKKKKKYNHGQAAKSRLPAPRNVSDVQKRLSVDYMVFPSPRRRIWYSIFFL